MKRAVIQLGVSFLLTIGSVHAYASDRPGCESLYRDLPSKSYLKPGLAASVAIHAGVLAIPVTQAIQAASEGTLSPSANGKAPGGSPKTLSNADSTTAGSSRQGSSGKAKGQVPDGAVDPSAADTRSGTGSKMVASFENVTNGKDSPSAVPMQYPEKPKTVFDELPTQPKTVASLEPKAVPVRSKEQLIAEAKDALVNWQKTGKLTLDLGKFFIESELADQDPRSRQLSPYLERYQNIRQGTLEAYRRPGGLRSALEYLNLEATANYCSEKAQVIDYFEEGCGNCEAHTKVLLGSLAQKGIELAPGQRLGAMLYSNHLEPVIFDPATDRVMPLSKGKWMERVEAPVYDPAFLLAAYLDGKQVGVAPELRQALLIRAMDESRDKTAVSNEGPQTNTRLRTGAFAHGPGVGGEIPRYARRSFAGGGGADSGDLSAGYSDGSPRGFEVRQGRLVFHGKPVDVMPFSSESLLDPVDRPYPSLLARSGDDDRYVLEIREPGLRARVKNAESGAEVTYHLLRAYEEEWKKLASGPSAKKLMSFWQNPQGLRALGPEEVEEMTQTVEKLGQFVQGYDRAGLTDVAPSWIWEGREARLKHAWPAEKALRAQAKEYSDYLNENQEAIAQGLEQMSTEDRKKFFRINQDLIYTTLGVPSPLARLRARFMIRNIQVRSEEARIASAGVPERREIKPQPLQVKILYVDKVNDPRFQIPPASPEAKGQLPKAGASARSGVAYDGQSRPKDPVMAKNNEQGTSAPPSKTAVLFGPETMVQFLLSAVESGEEAGSGRKDEGLPWTFGHEAMRVWGQADLKAALERVDPDHLWDRQLLGLQESLPKLDALIRTRKKGDSFLEEIKAWKPTDIFQATEMGAGITKKKLKREALPRGYAEAWVAARRRLGSEAKFELVPTRPERFSSEASKTQPIPTGSPPPESFEGFEALKKLYRD